MAVKTVAKPSPKKKYTIYHNPRCSKSRDTLELLKKAGVDVKVIEYLKTPIPAPELSKLLKQLKLEPHDLVRKDEERYIDLDLANDPPKSRAEWVRLLSNNPVLIQRPIVTDGKSAVLGRPPESINKLIGEILVSAKPLTLK